MTNLLSVKENYEDLQVIIAKDVKSADLEEVYVVCLLSLTVIFFYHYFKGQKSC